MLAPLFSLAHTLSQTYTIANSPFHMQVHDHFFCRQVACDQGRSPSPLLIPPPPLARLHAEGLTTEEVVSVVRRALQLHAQGLMGVPL